MTIARNGSLANTCQVTTFCSPTLRFIRHNVRIVCNHEPALVLTWRSVIVVFLIQAPVHILDTAWNQLDSVPFKRIHLLVWHIPIFVQPFMIISYLFGGPCEQGRVRTVRRGRAAPSNRTSICMRELFEDLVLLLRLLMFRHLVSSLAAPVTASLAASQNKHVPCTITVHCQFHQV